MAELKKVNTRIIHKHATAAVWHEKQFIPLQGEIIIYDPGYDPKDGVTYTYERMKVGDGARKVTDLPFVSNVRDWNQNDETAPDYVKNRTHYKLTNIINLDSYGDYSEIPGYDTESNFGYYKRFASLIPKDNSFTSVYSDLGELAFSEFEKTDIGKNLTIYSYTGDVENFNNPCALVFVYIPGDYTITPNVHTDEGLFATATFLHAPTVGVYMSSDIYAVRGISSIEENYIKLDEKYIPDSIARVVDIKNGTYFTEAEKYDILVDTTTINVEAEDFYYRTTQSPFTAQIIDGNKYLVIFDEVSYICYGRKYNKMNDTLSNCFDYCLIGDVVFNNGNYSRPISGSNLPFCIVNDYFENTNDFTADVLVFGDTASTHTIKIVDVTPTVKKLPEEFLADNFKAVTKGFGEKSAIFGLGQEASGAMSIAAGQSTVASGWMSIALGLASKASGAAALTLGQLAEASGTLAVAHGFNTKASGAAAVAAGDGTIAGSKCQLVHGKFNIEDTADTYAHIVGGGENNTNRKNIYALDWTGNASFAGQVAASSIKIGNTTFTEAQIARVDQYDKYGKDSFSANDTAKAISAKSAAFGFNTQAGSFAYTVTALDPVAKTFTLDSVEGLEVDDIYTVDLSFYRADGTATEEIYTNYGKITAISADNVVTVDTFPSDVARYRVPDEPYIDENGLDGEENVFRVIAKPNVGNRAIGTKSFAIGNSSQALSKNSVAMGKACIAYGAHSVAIGYDNKTAYAATSFGRSNTASGVKSVAIGYNNKSSGEGSIAFGNSNISSNKGSFASGTSNTATGANSFAAGHSNKVQGKYSIALGYNNTSSGEGSIAFGNSNISSSKGSFASGTSNTATGTNSFALGSTNRATGTSSFAHGYNNDATQTGSAVFGTNSKSQGESSFAAGAAVEASGHYSQAFGYKTKATGRASFAEGEGTIANGKHQHVQGKYNIEDTAIKYAHIIGNGTNDQNRKNIYTVDWNGNGWFAGSLTIGPDKDSIATMSDVNNKIEDTLLETLYINCGTASDLID